MGNAANKTGFFLFSLDVELGWGYYDSDRLRSRLLSPDGSRERKSVKRLLDLLDEYGITATWAVIGHLFYERCEACDICPVLEWKGKYRSFEEIYKTCEPLWYGADIIDLLLTQGARHEIAFHGYTHQAFNAISEEQAKFELQEWLRLGCRKGIVPRTVIFPRHAIKHLNIFRESGFICYRGKEDTPASYDLGVIGRMIRNLDYSLSITSPPVYELSGVDSSGMVNLPSSGHFFGYSRRFECLLDRLDLHNLRIKRMVKGVKKAANEGKVIHYWAHPWEFRTEKDFRRLRYLFSHVADEIDRGGIQSVGMAELAINTVHPTTLQ
jgi:hypothetical protein